MISFLFVISLTPSLVKDSQKAREVVIFVFSSQLINDFFRQPMCTNVDDQVVKLIVVLDANIAELVHDKIMHFGDCGGDCWFVGFVGWFDVNQGRQVLNVIEWHSHRPLQKIKNLADIPISYRFQTVLINGGSDKVTESNGRVAYYQRNQYPSLRIMLNVDTEPETNARMKKLLAESTISIQ